MFHQDPLEDWLFYTGFDIPPQRLAELQAQVHAGLDCLADFLDHPPLKPRSMVDVRLPLHTPVALDAADLLRAQDLYRRVYARGGTGNTYIQEGLLGLIAVTLEPASIPFWQDILTWTRPRDLFAVKRRQCAVAALALLAIRRGVPEAEATLWQLTQHPQAEVRELAVEYLGRTYVQAERPFPPDMLARVREIAAKDRAFGPRFQARAILRQAELPVPLDNPGGVYALKVKFGWNKQIYRTIELRSEQTLDDLHFAIQRAIHWDADHLYSFYMNGKLHDQRYAFACPYEDDRPPWTDEAVLGELGLTAGHKFLYYFDYGDCHQFEVEVVGIYPQAQAGVTYPRVVASRGQAPEQY